MTTRLEDAPVRQRSGASADVIIRTACEEGVKCPWPGLSAFEEDEARFFNGRTSETAELRRMVACGRLGVLFGASGLGKTSLLQAGLFPVLREENLLPVYVRLDVGISQPPLIDQVKSRLEEELVRNGISYPPFGSEESLWEWTHRERLELWNLRNHRVTPVLVLDQFEEVFTLGRSNPEAIRRLRMDLADLVEERVPAHVAARDAADPEKDEAAAYTEVGGERYRVLISLREDFLPSLEGWKREIPSLMRNRLRLLPLSREQAIDAVHRTAPDLASEEMAREIVDFVAVAQKTERRRVDSYNSVGEESWVDPALLSVVCSGLEERRRDQRKDAFDHALLRDTGDTIIAKFYDGALHGMPRRVRRFIQTQLITQRGIRKPYYLDDLPKWGLVTPEELQTLVDRRLLRFERQGEVKRVELTHDLLTGVVLQRRDRRITRNRRLMYVGLVLLGIAAPVGTVSYLHDRANRAEEQAQREAESARRDAALVQRIRDIERLRMESTREFNSVVLALRTADSTRQELLAAIESTQQRTFEAAQRDLEAERIAVLARQLNDPVRDLRITAFRKLAESENRNPIAADRVLDLLSERNLPSLSGDGRYNALLFLSRYQRGAWTEPQKRAARDALRRLREEPQQPPVGPNTLGLIGRVERQIAP